MAEPSTTGEPKPTGASRIPGGDYVLVPEGDFLMGCEVGRDEERPVHQVWLDAFEMAVFQVRNRDWARFLEAVVHPEPPNWNHPDFNHPDQPVTAVTWFEAVEYCEWLSRVAGRRYRLPTEAEWERAARGGYEGILHPWGNQPPQSRAEYIERWGGLVKGPLPVGLGDPNGFGIYDLCENVHEWCADWFEKNYYAASPGRNPRGPETGRRRSSRGGSWRHHVKASGCSTRSSIPPDLEYADYGFRVVRDAGQVS